MDGASAIHTGAVNPSALGAALDAVCPGALAAHHGTGVGPPALKVPSGLLLRRISRSTVWKVLSMLTAIVFTGDFACRPSAIATRSSWVKKRGEIVAGSGTITLPASMNHNEPQLVDTPTTSRGVGALVAGSDQFEVLPLHRGRHVVSQSRHRNIPSRDVRNHQWTSTGLPGVVDRRDRDQGPRRAGRQPARLRGDRASTSTANATCSGLWLGPDRRGGRQAVDDDAHRAPQPRASPTR